MMSRSTAQLNNLRMAVKARLAATGRPLSTMPSSRSSTSRRVMSLISRCRQRGSTCRSSSCCVPSMVRGRFARRQCSSTNCLATASTVSGRALRASDLLLAGVAAFGSRAQSLAGQVAGGLEIDCRIGAQGVLAGLAAAAIAHGPAAGAGRLQDQVKARQMAIGDLFPLGPGLMVSTVRTVRGRDIPVLLRGNDGVTP